MLDCIHIASMLGQTNLHMHMSMAMDCLLLASWLGAFVYTTMVRCILQSVTWRHDSNSRNCRTTRNKWPHKWVAMLDCIHIASMLGQTNLHMHMSMAMDCLLLASWLGAFVYTTMVHCILQSVTWRHDRNWRTNGRFPPRSRI